MKDKKISIEEQEILEMAKKIKIYCNNRECRKCVFGEKRRTYVMCTIADRLPEDWLKQG